MQPVTVEEFSVNTASGTLNALIHTPDLPGPLPWLVLVDGSGEGTADGWGEAPQRLAAASAVVLSMDKPGCGKSPGDWRLQTFPDGAEESLAALKALKAHPLLDGSQTGFYGVSQGGWISLLAAAMSDDVDFLISVSGPGVSPAEQERYRIETDLRSSELNAADIAAGLSWLDERTQLLLANKSAEQVLDLQRKFIDQPGYPLTTRYFDDVEMLSFLARNLGFDPEAVLPKVHCPVLATFGADDKLVPIPQSVVAFSQLLNPLAGNPHGLAVFPGADHGLYLDELKPGVSRSSQLAPGFMPMVQGFLARFA